MKQLTGLDGSFLYMETPTTFGHVNGLSIYERPSAEFDPYAAVYARFASKVGELEPMRRRVVEVPFHLDHPYWINDPNFDLDFHIRHMSLAPPGRVDQLAEQVSRIIGRPMDRSRPLWEVYVIEGLESGRWALLTKYHHATIDGASGVLMLNLLNDHTPDADPPGESPPWTPESVPSDMELLRLTLGNMVRNPAKAARVQMRIVRELADSAGINSVSAAAQQAGAAIKAVSTPRNGHRPRISMPNTSAPPTPWNRSVTAHRRFAIRSTSLSNLKRLKDATGGTLNDVVMAISAGALRTYLDRKGVLPDRPLRAMVPVSIRTGDEEDTWTNRVSTLVVDLPTNEPDPLRRVELCREAMNEAKQQFELVPAEALVDIQQFSSPVLATSAIRLAARLRLADRMAPPVNVTISNVPGPRQPLYLDGAKLQQYIPVSTIGEGMGLNITVHSYLDEMVFGLVSCRELVPDLWDLVDLHIDEIAVLFEATGAEWATPQPPAPPRRGTGARAATPAKRAAAKKKAVSRTTTTKRSAPTAAPVAKKATRATKATKATKATRAKKATRATKAPARTADPAAAAQSAFKRSAAKRSAAKRSAAKRSAAAPT
ncbi:MAG: wax ester/triacylglycerol synthase family O-acyltransferase [Ilumatobacteraceae bacterium]